MIWAPLFVVGDHSVRCLCGLRVRKLEKQSTCCVALAVVPGCHPDVDVLDLDETLCVDGGIVGSGDECFHRLIGFEFVFADLKLRGWSLEVEDGLSGEEAAGCLLVMLGERREVFRSGSGADGGERHVWLRVSCVSGIGSVPMAHEVASALCCCAKAPLGLALDSDCL